MTKSSGQRAADSWQKKLKPQMGTLSRKCRLLPAACCLLVFGCFRQALPDRYYVEKGNIYMLEGKDEDALKVYQEAVEINPHNAVARNNLGVALSRKKFYPEAEIQFERAVALNPNYKEAWNNLAAVYLVQRRAPEGRSAVDKALSIDPNYLAPLNIRARILEQEARYPEALAAFTIYLTAAGDDGEARHSMGRICLALGRREEAVAHFRRASAMAPRDPRPRRELAQMYWADGNIEAARRESQAVVDLDEDDGELQYKLAQDAADQRLYKTAVKRYRKVLAMEKKNLEFRDQVWVQVESQRDLARIHEKMDQPTLAIHHWAEYLRLVPSDQEAPQRITALRSALEANRGR